MLAKILVEKFINLIKIRFDCFLYWVKYIAVEIPTGKAKTSAKISTYNVFMSSGKIEIEVFDEKKSLEIWLTPFATI